MLRKRSRRVSTNAAAISSPVQMPWKRFWNFVKPLRMQLVRTAQPKHKINLLSLSTEAGGPDVGHLVCSINSMQFVRTAQFKHKHLLVLYSHSPRRTGGPQAPASGALVYIYCCMVWWHYYRVLLLSFKICTALSFDLYYYCLVAPAWRSN